MTIAEFAHEIYENLGSPTDITEELIETWLTNSTGNLNTKLNLSISAVDGSFVPELSDKEKAIYQKIFEIYYLGLQINRNLGASAYDWSELTEADSTIRRVSKNELAKTYRGLQNDARIELVDMINKYRFDKSMPTGLKSVDFWVPKLARIPSS